jgi:hypothetical protein
MKRVIALICVVMVATQGCSANRVKVMPRHSTIHQPYCPHPSPQTAIPPVVESEELKIRRLEAITAAVIVAGRVTFEILRVIR